ncbi:MULTISPECIES: hybrid sensor histidine kinase/response regulator [Roseovarius]|uniref:hybrid sensor histidine kinase/response regulator n=1 Tax=Roseovarius TaxID=74030 RepID=UPI00273D3D27|nr:MULTISPECIES: PAS domain-containing sensor histidine kinase [unclassified Roseovarius]
MTDTPKSVEPTGPDGLDTRLAMFVEDAPAAVAMFDRNMRYVAWSRFWAERYGLVDKDLRRVCHYDIFPNLPDHIKQAHQRGLAGEGLTSHEDRLVLNDGCVRWERWRTKPVRDAQDVVVGIAVFTEDITKQKEAEFQLQESETRLRLLVDALGIGTIDLDISTGKIEVSDAFLEMTDLEDKDLPADFDGWIVALNPLDEEAFRESRGRAFDPEGDGLFRAEVRPGTPKKGRELQLVGRVLFEGTDNKKKAARFVGILIDQTERNELQMSAARSQRLEAIGRIAGIIAHDSNNLLSVILANLELAAMRVSDPATYEYLQVAMDAAEMGGGFNKKLLSLSGARNSQPTLIRLDEHILKTWAMLERLLNEHISLRFSAGADDYCVRIDPAELDGAILNLVVNARDAQPNSGEIIITTKDVEIDAQAAKSYDNGKPGHYLELSVSDNGVGMTPIEVKRAKEPFITSKSPEMGTGLGLTSVFASVERVNGFVSIVSEKGEGTTVSIFLPVADGIAHREEREAEIPMGNGEMILVVEDDALVREATLKRLEALGYAVIEAADGETALQLLSEGEVVDLVFSDVILPGTISGYDIAETVREQYSQIAVLLTSGHVSGRRLPRHPRGRLPELLKKPYPLTVLAQAVERALSPRGKA